MKKILLPLLLIASFCTFASEPYQNPALTPEVRANDLLSKLTLQEKVGLMMDQSHPVERLGIKPFHWWNEALHGVARAGLATVFPQPIGLAATFDPQLIEKIYTAVSDEARAKNTRFVAEGSFKRFRSGVEQTQFQCRQYQQKRFVRNLYTCIQSTCKRCRCKRGDVRLQSF